MSERLRDGCGRASAGRWRRAPFGRRREREQRGIGTEGETRESERGSRGPRGVTAASRRSQAGWEGGGCRGAWPRAPGACPSSWQRRKATEGVAVAGWAAGGAGPGKWAPGKWLGFSLFLYFCSVFYLIATEFKFKQI